LQQTIDFGRHPKNRYSLPHLTRYTNIFQFSPPIPTVL
jgi:hypothetical protein